MSIESVMPSNLLLCHPLLFLPSIFPSKGSLPLSCLSASCSPIIGASGSASVFPKNIQDLIYDYYQYFKSDWEVWPPCCPRDSQESSPTLQFESINSLALSLLHGLILTSIHDYWKKHSCAICTFIGKVISLLFNMLSRFIIAFLPRSMRLIISWL